jgi:hypothetical protein
VRAGQEEQPDLVVDGVGRTERNLHGGRLRRRKKEPAMVLWLVGPALTITATVLVVYPTKNDPLRPGRKRRDWPLVIGLFVGGVLATHLWLFLTKLLFGRYVKGAKLAMAVAHSGSASKEGSSWGLSDYFYLGVAALLLFLAVDEAKWRPDRERNKYRVQTSAHIVQITPSADAVGYSHVTLRFVGPDGRTRTIEERNLQAGAASIRVGGTWPDPVRYSPDDDSATVRPPEDAWNHDVQMLAICAAVLLLYTLVPHFR